MIESAIILVFGVYIMTVDYSKLSKEELIAKLICTQQACDKAKAEKALIEAKANAIEAKANAIEAKANAIEAKTLELTKQVEELRKEKQAILMLVAEFIATAKPILEQMNKSYFLFDEDAFSQDIINGLRELFDSSLQCFNAYKSHYTQLFGKGNDINSTALNPSKLNDNNKEQDKELSEIEKQLNKLRVSGSLKNNARHIKKIQELILEAQKLQEESNNPESNSRLQNIIEILNTEAKNSNKPKQTDTKPKGRRATNNFTNCRKVKTKATLGAKKCSCGDSKPVKLCAFIDNCISQLGSLKEQVQPIVKEFPVYVCESCGKCFIPHEEHDDHPVLPNRSLGASICRAICGWLYNGSPMERYTKAFAEEFHLGHETIARNLHDFVCCYFEPIYNVIYERAKLLDVLLVDETVFDCLQDQGKGNMSKEMRESIDNGEIETKQKNYVLVMTSAPPSESKLTYYSYINSRSTDSISQVITEDFQFTKLVSDAYASYQSICEQKAGRKWQTCLVHFRRELIKACNPKDYAQKLESLSEEKAVRKILEDFSSTDGRGQDATVMLSSFFAVAKIYEIENALSYSEAKDKKLFWLQKQQNRQQIKELFNQIDEGINSIKDKYTKLTKTGKYKSSKKGNSIASAIVYYLNNKDNFKTFLNYPDVPPDSNTVEGMIRKLAVLRSAMKQKVSPEAMQDLCKIMTVYKTLEMNSIDPDSYMRKLTSSMYFHALTKGIELHLAESGIPDKGQPIKANQILNWNMSELLSDFDFSPFDIFNKK